MANTYRAIATVTVGSGGAASIDFTSIPASYTDLVVKLSLKGIASGGRNDVYWKVNNDNSSLYSYRRLIGYDNNLVASGSAAAGAPAANSSTAFTGGSPTSTFGSLEIYFPNYTSSNNKGHTADWVGENNSTTDWIVGMNAYLYASSNAISSLYFYAANGNFAQYSTATLYGIKNS